jgi:hypothetical protein
MTRAHPERVRGYLQHIVEAIDRASGYVDGMDAAAFQRDTRTGAFLLVCDPTGQGWCVPAYRLAAG